MQKSNVIVAIHHSHIFIEGCGALNSNEETAAIEANYYILNITISFHLLLCVMNSCLVVVRLGFVLL